jgi:hypothetical protein
VLGAGAFELVAVARLADVVGRGAEEDGVPVEAQIRELPGEPVGDVVHGTQVRREAGWGVECFEQLGSRRRQWPHRGDPAAIGERKTQRVGCHAGNRSAVLPRSWTSASAIAVVDVQDRAGGRSGGR